jgi:hypothetical protein
VLAPAPTWYIAQPAGSDAEPRRASSGLLNWSGVAPFEAVVGSQNLQCTRCRLQVGRGGGQVQGGIMEISHCQVDLVDWGRHPAGAATWVQAATGVRLQRRQAGGLVAQRRCCTAGVRQHCGARTARAQHARST